MNLLPFFILAVFLFLIDYYVFQGIKTLTSTLNPFARNVIHVGHWLGYFILLAAVIYAFLSIGPDRQFSTFSKWAFNTFLTLVVTKLVFILVLFGEDMFRLVETAWNSYQKPKADNWMPERRKFVSQVGLALAAIPFSSFLYGVTKGKYNYKVIRETISFKDLPEAFDGFTITQISDVHSGSFDDPEEVKRGINLIKEANSDLFVFTGDIVNNVATEIEPYIDAFSEIKAPYGQFSILGNHDYGDYVAWNSEAEKKANLDRLKSNHAKMDFRLLLDENIKIEKDGQHIQLLGVENWGKGFGERGKLHKALADTSHTDFKVLLSHDPSHWDEQVKNNPNPIHLTLSGHTHGMQFGIEIPGFRWSPSKYRYPNWAGLAKHADRYLYVNRGFGFLGFSGRVGIWPEITVITLKKA
ncbi:metallophosphoesterase [Penaeicola halotolerans]|uniref:metallophosphoesterase n=1 Tax=Penaeicola halotolerans TaxID=2793196 RepID=UPI001CF8BD97|nr:metallophosphoesterase [Penaeicola halotolerans]